MFDFSQEQYIHILEELIPFQKMLKMKVLDLKQGYSKIEIPFQDFVVGDPRKKRWHGGVISTVIDAACGASCFMFMSHSEDKISTLDMRVDFLKGGKPEKIHAEAHVIREGSHTYHTEAKAFHPSEPDIVLARGMAVMDLRLKSKEQR